MQTLLIGNQKRPYGLDHLNSSRYNVFLERPFIIESFNEDARRIGVASYGVSDDQSWNWRYGVYNMEKAHPDGQYVGDHYQLEVAGRLANTAWYDECTDGRSYMHWAVSGTIAHPDGTGGPTNSNESRFHTRPEARTSRRWLNTGRIAGANTYGLLGLEGVVNLGPTQVVAEWQNIRLDRTTGVLGGEGESLTFALNWHWNAHAKVQLNYIFGQVEDRGVGLPAVTSGDYQIFGTRFAVDF